MPGTVHVSVLDFNGSQSISPESSIKVSLGKREFQTWDKGDFSFPLTTLRDNLIITLQDAEGNEISHTSVETKLVIEKGTWDDIFSLDGGINVHMKLQFVLNDDDRQRIRTMRESAWRKKQEELVNAKLGSPEYGTRAGSIAASPLPSNHEVSDKYEQITSTTPTSRRLDIHCKKGSNEFEAYAIDSSLRNAFSEEASCVGSSGSVDAPKVKVAAKLKGVGATDPEKQSTQKKPPSSVRNMISAFEGSLNQELSPKMKPQSIKPQVTKTITEIPSERSYLDQVKTPPVKSFDSVSERVGNTYHLVNVKQAPIEVKGKEQNFVSVSTTMEAVSCKGTNGDLKKAIKSMDKEFTTVEEKVCSEQFIRASTGERASVSGRMLDEQSGTHQSSNLHIRKQHSDRKGTLKRISGDLNNQGAYGGELYSSEYSGSWIFPGEGKYLCITTGGKQIMNQIGNCQAAAKNPPEKMSSFVRENVKEFTENGGNGTEPKGAKTSHRLRNPEIDGSTDNENHRGLLGQVMRVAVMVGFATLVIFTRKRTSP